MLLQVARQILPVGANGKDFAGLCEGRQGVLRLGVECHPCYQWLKGILADFLAALPDMDVDMVNKFQFSGLEGLLNHHVDLLITPDVVKKQGVVYQPLFDYELVLLVNDTHALSGKTFINAEQFK